MEKTRKTAKLWLCISLALILLSGIVVSAVQTSGYTVVMKELNIETDAGYSMSAYLFIPPNATAETPAPGIVCSHGYLNNKEMQDANYVELARRGFVVLAIDQPNHGDSEVKAIPNTEMMGATAMLFAADGVYNGAVTLSRMPFVDKAKIGITGHSMGGMSCNWAINADNLNETRIISAVLLNCADATYQDGGAYANIYGGRDVAILSAQYDEFFHGYTDENGVSRAAPYFMEGPSAQSFLYCGTDPAGKEALAADTIYRYDVDGEEAIRVIYRPDIIHPWSHFSAKSTRRVIEFFDAAFGAPKSIASTDQVWQWKEAFNFVGVIGLAIFLCAFTTLMVHTPVFSALCAQPEVKPAPVKNMAGALWFWLSLLAGALFGMLIYRWALATGTGMTIVQNESMGLGLWSSLCGLFTILCMVVSYFAYGRKNGMDLEERGVKIGAKKLGLTVLLALIVVTVAYGIVFVMDYFFFSDFRLWTLAIKAFELPILRCLPYIFLFFPFYIASSVATNSFNYNTIGGKFNGIIVGCFTALPALILPWMQYIHYYTQKAMLWPDSNMHILWLFPIVLILFGSTIINRMIYKATKNPYLGGLINALIVGLMTITNTCTIINP
ncbi:MAG: alpha/beta fold hydrolase [Clostridia bacterium]|nr:alpha/beta fold hydrolase [Clostridia bacterium]